MLPELPDESELFLVPFLMIFLMMESTSSIGMANPMLSMDASEEELPEEYLALVMPMTSPYRLNSGPPELPELMAASV